MRSTAPLLLVCLALTACKYITPIDMYASSLPATQVPEHVQEVTARRCRPFLFGAIPLRKNYLFADLVSDAGGGPHAALYGVTTDQERIIWVVGYTQCTRLHAWIDRADVVPAPVVPTAARVERVRPVQEPVEAPPGRDERDALREALLAQADVLQIPRTATRGTIAGVLADVYLRLQRETPPDAVFSRDWSAIRNAIENQHVSPGTLVDRVLSAARSQPEGTPVEQLLR